MQEMAFQRLQIKNFFGGGGACTRTPLGQRLPKAGVSPPKAGYINHIKGKKLHLTHFHATKLQGLIFWW
jgi:hypothetical protein